MRLSGVGEFGLIKKLRDMCAGSPPGLIAGIGDDAAAVRTGNRNILVTSDMMIEGVHFDLSFTTFYQLGYKFLAVNISDIFAMGGRPGYFFASLGIPRSFRTADIEELYTGIKKIADESGVTVAGGDTCASGAGFVLSGTLTGEAKRVIKRSGAKKGDGVFVTDTLGDSAMGLRLLKRRGRRVRSFSSSAPRLKLMKRHLMPEPRPAGNLSAITSMIDVSDGLLADLGHICDESRVGAVIYRDKIPVSAELAGTAKSMNIDPVELALRGGEDYALLFTAPPGIRTRAFRIGEITGKGRFIIDEKGRKAVFKSEGYEHFR
ncbi:MAG: thiamine-phosphate kinase [Deferribacteres bacterium]|nr:thiamine-phosphate kinase [Deferribacteres bacterium]